MAVLAGLQLASSSPVLQSSCPSQSHLTEIQRWFRHWNWSSEQWLSQPLWNHTYRISHTLTGTRWMMFSNWRMRCLKPRQSYRCSRSHRRSGSVRRCTLHWRRWNFSNCMLLALKREERERHGWIQNLDFFYYWKQGLWKRNKLLAAVKQINKQMAKRFCCIVMKRKTHPDFLGVRSARKPKKCHGENVKMSASK